LKVVLGTLKDKGEQLATFLEPRVGAKPSVSGDAIEIEDESIREGVRPRQVKTYIKRFLYMNGVRKNYRVFVAGKELTIQEIVLGEKKEEEEKPAQREKAPAVEKAAEEQEAEAETEKEEPKAEKPKKAPSKKPRPKKKKAESKS
jgi:sRNA-binding protein